MCVFLHRDACDFTREEWIGLIRSRLLRKLGESRRFGRNIAELDRLAFVVVVVVTH